MSPDDDHGRRPGATFWKIAGAGAAFQAGAAAVDSATSMANLIDRLTGNLFAVSAASAILRLGWLLPQIEVVSSPSGPSGACPSTCSAASAGPPASP